MSEPVLLAPLLCSAAASFSNPYCSFSLVVVDAKLRRRRRRVTVAAAAAVPVRPPPSCRPQPRCSSSSM